MDETDAARPDLARSPEPLGPATASERRQEPAPALPTVLGPPGIGIAGFVCGLFGVIVPFAGIVGLILSIVGYRQARRESRPYGLALAGLIIGIIEAILTIFILTLLVFGGPIITVTGGD